MKHIFVKLSFLTLICLTRCTNPKDLLYDTPTNAKSTVKERDENLSLRKSENLLMKQKADKFAEKLIEIGNAELGTGKIKDVMELLDFKLMFDEDKNQVKKLSEGLNTKVTSYLKVLNHTVSLIEDFKQHSKKLTFVNVPCIYISENGSYEEPSNLTTLDFNNIPLSILNLTEGFTMNMEAYTKNHIQYFISEMESERLTHVFSEDLKGDKCILMDDPHFQRVFFKTVSKEPKNLILLVDNGGSLSENQFSNAKTLATHIVSSLSEDDKMSVFAVSDSLISAASSTPQHCSNLTMVHATDSNKHQFIAFVDELNKTKGPTNHSLAFSMAFQTIEMSVKNESGTTLVVYISRGLMSSIAEAKTVMEVISKGQDAVLPNVIINTCVLIDDGKTILYEKHFLSVVAQQNFSMYDIPNRKNAAGVIVKGTMVSVNSSSNMGAVVRTALLNPLHTLNTEPSFLLPHWDVIKKGDLVVSITQAAKDKEGNLLGVVGIDVPLEDLAEDFLYFNTQKNSYYVFLTTKSGKVVAHPLLKKPSAAFYEQPFSLDIGRFETCPAFPQIRSIIYQNASGIWKSNQEKVTYNWKHVAQSPYVVVSASRRPPRGVVWPVPSPVMPPSMKLAYHRLDLPPTKYHLCRNFRQLSSLDTGSLFLSSWCFQSPYKYLSSEHNISQLNVQSYMAYLKDTTKLLANPGLKPHIRDQIISIVEIIPLWKKLYVESSLSKYIIRKYIVSSSGAVVMYPGGVLDHRLDILRRSWYLKAVQYPNQVTLSPPYLDSAGAGYVVTLSIALGDEPLSFVLSIDFSPGAMFHLLVESMPECWSPFEAASGTVKCFLMDERGYLIAHPTLFEPLIKTTADEQYHIMHRESLLANDLLNHKGLVKKLVCNDFASNTVQRFYQFNMSLDHVVTNMISGEQCGRYQLTYLARTNTFLGIVNTSCNLTAFCPCPTTDRTCLNCHRMEQNECECPCECALDPGMCEGEEYVLPSNQPCPHTSEPTLHFPESVLSVLPSLKTCHHHDCDQLPTHQTCLGVVGCEWCQLQADRVTLLPTPFCTHQTFCYNGVLGSNGETARRPISPGDGNSSSVPVGSVGCTLFILMAAIFLMVYCYCKHAAGRRTSYMAPDSSFHMLTMNHPVNIIEEPPTGANTDLVSNAQELSVALLSPAVSISPYRMSTGYRRPATGDSDHGYSTMTPHEDTEPPEPASNHSPLTTPQPPRSQTLLSPHHIIAPVTVHMAMES